MSYLYHLRDNDIIQLLNIYVHKAYIKKKEKEARNFHYINYYNGIDENKEIHYFISDCINNLNYIVMIHIQLHVNIHI